MSVYEGTLLVPVIILIAGLAIGYIMGERSGRKEEAERMSKVQAILMPKTGWQGEQTLREFASGETPPIAEPPPDTSWVKTKPVKDQ